MCFFYKGSVTSEQFWALHKADYPLAPYNIGRHHHENIYVLLAIHNEPHRWRHILKNQEEAITRARKEPERIPTASTEESPWSVHDDEYQIDDKFLNDAIESVVKCMLEIRTSRGLKVWTPIDVDKLKGEVLKLMEGHIAEKIDGAQLRVKNAAHSPMAGS